MNVKILPNPDAFTVKSEESGVENPYLDYGIVISGKRKARFG